MLVKYIDSNYIIEELQKPSWGEVEEPDFYITMASNRVKTLIFPSEQGDPNNLASYTEEQQDAIKLATAIYSMWYFDTNYDFTNGSVSVNFGGVSMSESKTYNGEMVLPNVFDILKQANLIPTTETFIFSGENNIYATNSNINPEAFKQLQQEVERQADVNIKQDAKLVELNDKIAHIDTTDIKEDVEEIKAEQIIQNQDIQANRTGITDLETKQEEIKQEIETINQEQEEQNTNIENNTTEIETVKTDLGHLGDQVIDVQNKTNENATNIAANTTQIEATTKLLNDVIEEAKKKLWISYEGTYQPGTTYSKGDLVVLNGIFYLSNANDNNTNPPGALWDIIENPTGGEVDLSNYYNKQEIDAQQTAQDANITLNTTKITDLQNKDDENVKKTGNQSIAGIKTFTNTGTPIQLNPNSNNATFIAGYKPNNQRLWFIGKGSSTTDSLIIGTDIGDVHIQAKGNVNVNNKRIINTGTPTTSTDATNKSYVDNAISNPNIYQGSLELVGTATTSLVNKEYVDTKGSLFTIYNTLSVYSNLQNFNIANLFTNNSVDYNKPLYVSFQRTNAGGANLGEYTGTIFYTGTTNSYYMVATNMYRNPSGSMNMEIGDMCGVFIQYKNNNWNLQVQCWNTGNDRIKNIKIQGWRKI